ncbi:MAG: xanthine dehydrogenase family protein subunit M [Desulfobacterales bacterium]|nr:xanthine dehydrogenase family protein subunit M [Desulfobacterales bacterium]
MKMNTRIISHEFDYHAPDTIREVLEMLDQHGSDAKIIAGGTDLITQMKMGKRTPSHVVDIRKLKDLRYYVEGAVIKIGAGNNFRSVMEHFANNVPCRGLYEAIYSIGKTQVLNMGTIGGNLSNGSPKADTAPPLLTYNARVKLLSLKSERLIDLKDLHVGYNKTVMEENEIMTEIQFDALPKNTAGAFEKKARVGSDISKITCAVTVTRDNDVCRNCNIALGAAAPVPMRAPVAESIMKGRPFSDQLLEDTALQVGREINPPAYGRTSVEYRREMVAVMFKDGFKRAWEQAGGDK